MSGNTATTQSLDVVIVGAGFAGLYLAHELRRSGFSFIGLEAAPDVGGTWYWNRYPGARCDIQSIDYSYSFDPELEKEWQWSEKFATQPEILEYINTVADKHDLKKHFRFSTRLEKAHWEEASSRWQLNTSQGDTITTRFLIMATGCLSVPKVPDIPGAGDFTGSTYLTGLWPHEGVDFTGKRVAVIGTGSSAIQSIPLIAQQASEVTVFQRTPNFSIPARNGPVPQDKQQSFNSDVATYREAARHTIGGVSGGPPPVSAYDLTPEEQRERLESIWNSGDLIHLISSFNETVFDENVNRIVVDFMHDKIRSIVNDPETANSLCPDSFPFGTKRPCLDTNYYENFNLPHVHLTDLRKTPITTITSNGVLTSDGITEVDCIVFATGFDAMTGALLKVDIEGRDGLSLSSKWKDGPKTYLGLTVEHFPNLFMVTGPGSPSVLSNMMVSIEQHVEWIHHCLLHMQANSLDTVEATANAESGWVTHVNAVGDTTLYPKANSWYVGANVPGKPRVFMPYVGGVGPYRGICDEVANQDYLGFTFTGNNTRITNDGIIRPSE